MTSVSTVKCACHAVTQLTRLRAWGPGVHLNVLYKGTFDGEPIQGANHRPVGGARGGALRRAPSGTLRETPSGAH